mmetsp:Transcript_28498/g.37277  ORF Transcript_28498/g.37277 Transcript_28498/m.37277 type:complete len:87 (+) Transcript_28498:438-698(+)
MKLLPKMDICRSLNGLRNTNPISLGVVLLLTMQLMEGTFTFLNGFIRINLTDQGQVIMQLQRWGILIFWNGFTGPKDWMRVMLDGQ